MRVAFNSFSTNFLSQINQLQERQNTLQQQAASGQKVTLPEDDPVAMAQVLQLQSTASANTQYQSNISRLQNTATTSYTAMSSLKTISDRVGEIAIAAANSTTSDDQLASYAKEVNDLIQQAVAIGNTKDPQGNYIFGGTKTDAPPFVSTADANKIVTGVTYSGNTAQAESEIAPNVTISARVPGANTSGSGPAGLFSDSRTGADFFNHLVSLQQNLTAKDRAAISTTDTPQLAKDETNIITQISGNGVLQSTLSSATNIAAAQSTNLTAEMSSTTNADLATTLTQLTQTQTAYQAALASGSKIFGLSLLNYLQ